MADEAGPPGCAPACTLAWTLGKEQRDTWDPGIHVVLPLCRGADTDPDDAKGRAPLHYAALGTYVHGRIIGGVLRCLCIRRLMYIPYRKGLEQGPACTTLPIHHATVMSKDHVSCKHGMACWDRDHASIATLPGTCTRAHAGGHAEVVRYLLSKSAWVDATDGADDTPLHLAARGLPPSIDTDKPGSAPGERGPAHCSRW